MLSKICNGIKRKIENYKARKAYLKVLKEISNYLKSHGVTFIFVELPVRSKITGLTEFEKERLDNWSFDFNKYKEELPKLKMLYGEDVTQEYILSVFDGGVVVQGEKRKVLLDFESEHQHIINGRRVTIGQPAKYKNTIYTHGACTFRGTGVEDQQTIASYLQAEVNKEFPNSYRVVNSAIGRGSNIFDDFEYIKEQQYIEGDIVIVGGYGKMIQLLTEKDFKKMKISRITTSQLFCQPHNHGTWFNDLVLHTNHNGNKAIANHIFASLDNMHILTKANPSDLSSRKPPMPKDTALLTKGEKIYGDNPDLLKYIDSLKPYKRGDEKSINGSIVMNCNPFTLGHRYLIEYASSQVENLYIFVVEENRSYFTFDDRLDLVRKGTADLKNVIVLPSGNFIISATTFPGHFYKDNLKEAKIDCSNDLSVFAQYIAPALNIKIRFAGEEPLDPVTNQYNEGMKEILPQYGMEFRAIPRKEDDEGIGVISASRVRRHFEKGELAEIKKIVPQTTFDYLVARYHREHPNG